MKHLPLLISILPTSALAYEDIGAEIIFPQRQEQVVTRRAPQVRSWERRAPEPQPKRLVVDVEWTEAERAAPRVQTEK
jgi:hypothetical protein